MPEETEPTRLYVLAGPGGVTEVTQDPKLAKALQARGYVLTK